jgi:hypothetical protein
MRVRSDNEADFRVFQSSQKTYPLVQQCQRGLNVISALRFVGLFRGRGYSGIRGKEIFSEREKVGSAHRFVGQVLSLWVLRHNMKKIKC